MQSVEGTEEERVGGWHGEAINSRLCEFTFNRET